VTLTLNITLALAAAARNPNICDALLDRFVHEVNAQTGGAFTREQARVLTTLAAALR
jgi:hypothetical protein